MKPCPCCNATGFAYHYPPEYPKRDRVLLRCPDCDGATVIKKAGIA